MFPSLGAEKGKMRILRGGDCLTLDEEALRSGFGQEFVQDYVGKLQSEPFRLSDPVRLRYVWTFLKSKSKAA